MKSSITTKPIILAAALTTIFSAGAFADDAPANIDADAVSLKQAIMVAKKHTGGEPMEAEREVEMGQALYEIELIGDNGNNFYTVISATTGEVVISREKHERDHDDLIEQAAWLSGVKSGQFKSLEAALSDAENQNSAQVYEIELEDDHNVSYEMKLVKADGSTMETRLAAQ